ncbi:hypothetical protein KIS1582_4265 [Cytobacillus firmus]|uniref:Uncharacterized protein n=1 Tax=Cytobacillus firmus TaxID=1399 RepID=A0A800MT98_CYTFI|nr:hypothetical protein KIS1582_4265 [Cytobacillus firmus]
MKRKPDKLYMPVILAAFIELFSTGSLPPRGRGWTRAAFLQKEV